MQLPPQHDAATARYNLCQSLQASNSQYIQLQSLNSQANLFMYLFLGFALLAFLIYLGACKSAHEKTARCRHMAQEYLQVGTAG